MNRIPLPQVFAEITESTRLVEFPTHRILEGTAMTEPTSNTGSADTGEITTEGSAGKDPSNTPIEELTAPLDPDDDVHQRIALVNSSTEEDLRGADQ